MSASPPDPPLQNPIVGTTIDTSPQTLGLTEPGNGNAQTSAAHMPVTNAATNSSPSRSPSNSKNVLKRTMEQATSKLGNSMLNISRRDGRGSGAQGNRLSASVNNTSPRHTLSLGRRWKDKERTDSDGGESLGQDSLHILSQATKRSSRATRPSISDVDDSPFIRPRSTSPPPSPPQRPSLEALKTLGSMRAGTQTLIQAIQAYPWTDEPEGDDEAIPPTAINSDSSEEEQTGLPLTSSIHTIHRPIAWSKKHDSPTSLRPSNPKGKNKLTIVSSDDEDINSSDDDGEDFETTPIDSRHIQLPSSSGDATAATERHMSSEKMDQLAHLRRSMTRSASLATVRIKRRARLAEKLKEVFGLNDINEVIAELPCWLIRSVLLQGYMYLTNSHLCFFAHLPSREDQVLKSGSLNKKTQRTKRWVKHWFVLKNDVLSWYQSSSDPYFPHGVLDLRYALSCEAWQERGFRIRTNQKVVTLSADSVPSRDEWVKAVRKVIFKAQNAGESVKIAIPYSVVVDIEKSSAMDFSETIEVKVIDAEDRATSDAYDSYFFAYFHNMASALEQIRDAVRTYKPQVALGSPDAVRDTTGLKVSSSSVNASPLTHTMSLPAEPQATKSGYSLKLPIPSIPFLRPFQSDSAHTPTQHNQTRIGRQSDTITPSTSASSSKTVTRATAESGMAQRALSDTAASPSNRLPDYSHTYPPPPSPESELLSMPTGSSTGGTSSWTGWLKGPKRVFNSPSALSSGATIGRKGVSEVISNPVTPHVDDSVSSDFGFSVLETRDHPAEPEIVEKFRTTFAFDEKEHLLGYFPGYLFRILPTYGRLYISTNYFCFKSSGPLATRTRMKLPILDILSLEKAKAYSFSHVGLVVIIKGHEELFFEFSSSDRRDAFINLLEKSMENSQSRLAAGETELPSEAQRDALLLEELEPSCLYGEDDPRPPPESMTDSLPAVMFTSTSSTFLTFKPQRSLHFTCLTIGSRGDVQPYIALAKGLMADGHKVRIATHGEFKEWVESHGIEFGYVGGDPAELMRICVENGMFTFSFMKESLQKFRGWIDDLLKTSWEACQGTDVLIESPSAMAGIHVAEALKIPYYRAFTMTWTRTRAYPHAFAVPEHKMGGGYNYMSYVAFDQVFWRATAGQINRWRRNTLKLESTNLDKLEPHKVPFLYNFSPTVVPPPLDWPEWIRVTGYWTLEDAEVSAQKWTPPQDLVEFIDGAHRQDKKVVYVGFGSIVVSDPEAMTKCVVEAIMRSGVYAILSKGWSDRLQMKKGSDAVEPEVPLPLQIYSIKSIPHDWLFSRIEAACHHGGAGTTGASLRAGIPTIIKPFFGDQFFWGDRVEALGVGTSVRKLTVDNLADAFVTATTDEKQIAKAKLIGQRIRAENGVATAIESIYRDLEYARTLVKAARLTAGPDDDGTIRDDRRLSFNFFTSDHRNSGDSALDSGHEAQSEDWSVISDSDERRSSRRSSEHRTQSPTSKRSSIAAVVFSVLPDAFQPGSPNRGASRNQL